MIEIIILIILCGKIGKIVEPKGRKKIGYQLMLIGFWIGGELFGGFVGGIIGAIVTGNEDAAMLCGVPLALICAITGAIVAFQIAKNVEPLVPEDDFYHGDDYDERWRSRPRTGEGSRQPGDAYTDSPERPRPRSDDRIQE